MKENKFYKAKDIDKKQSGDSGMAVVLILLLIGLFTKNDLYYKIAIPVLVLVMAFPMLFRYIAVLWFGLSQILGTIASRILLSIIYFIILLPVGIFRRMTGKDNLLLKQFKKTRLSVFLTRNHHFKSENIIKPY